MSQSKAEQTKLVRDQFGPNAANYATSSVHAKGASLSRFVELVNFQADWRALDIATAAGHTAFAVAPHVSAVVASDLTPQMLEVAASQAAARDITNVTFEPADAEALPFDDDSFDLVTCRIAPHHFGQPDRFIAEVARVLRPGGTFVLIDNVVPDDPDVAQFANDWERRRDPSHVRCLSVGEWLDLITTHGLSVEHSELMAKRMPFSMWAENMNVPSELRTELLTDLEQAPAPVAAFLRPDLGPSGDQDAAAFHLTECIIVATR